MTHKAIALARDGADKALLLTAVVYRVTNRIDSGRDRSVRNDAALPDHLDQIVVADHTGAIDDQKFQDIEDLRLYGNDFAVTTQLASVMVKAEVFKLIDQVTAYFSSAPQRKLRNPKNKLRLSQRPRSRQTV